MALRVLNIAKNFKINFLQKLFRNLIIRNEGSESGKISNISVLLHGVKPQGIKEEDFISKQQIVLLKKLKQNNSESSPANEEEECSTEGTLVKCCSPGKNPSQCKEEYYFYKQDMDSIEAFKKYKTKAGENVD